MNTNIQIFGNVIIYNQTIPNPAPADVPNVENPPIIPPYQLRAQRDALEDYWICENPHFWRKIETLPDHLRLVFQPGCDLWDHQVYKETLRLVISHFVPGLFMAQKTSKPEYIGLFYRHVLTKYGARERNMH